MRLIKFVVNWSILLSAPIWAGFYFQNCFVKELFDNTGTTRETMAGKDWIWRNK